MVSLDGTRDGVRAARRPARAQVPLGSYVHRHVEEQGVSSREHHGAHLALVGPVVGRERCQGRGGRGGGRRRGRLRADRSEIVRGVSGRSPAPRL